MEMALQNYRHSRSAEKPRECSTHVTKEIVTI
jgi:hypothetical protein